MNGNIQTIRSVRTHRKPLLRQKGFWLGALFLLSFAFRTQDFYLFREFNADKAHQLQAAYELLQGRGVSLKTYDLNTFEAHGQFLLAWPPGYSYFVAAVSKVTGFSVYRSSWALDLLALALLWAALFWFTVLLRFTLLQSALLFLLAGFCRSPWIYTWSADALGTALFLTAAALNVHFVQASGRRPMNKVFFAAAQAALITAMCFLKYSLLPAYAALALSLFSFSWKAKRKQYRTGLLLLAMGAVSFAALQVYNRLHSGGGDMANLHQQQTGWFFGNLKMYSAFFLKSFVYIDGFLDKTGSLQLMVVVQWLNAAIVIAILLHAGSKMWGGCADYFSHLVFWTTLSVCGFLTFLSLRYGQQVFIGTYRWTYVKEIRYFLPVAFLLLLYLLRHFRWRLPRREFSAFAFAFIGGAAVYGFALHSYYRLSKNRAGSFQNMTGRLIRAEQFVQQRSDSNTYFVAMTGNSATDAEATSLIAMDGAKVVISYDGTFPDAYLSPLFEKGKTMAPGKKVIIYLGENTSVADSLNPLLPHHMEQDADGENFLFVHP